MFENWVIITRSAFGEAARKLSDAYGIPVWGSQDASKYDFGGVEGVIIIDSAGYPVNASIIPFLEANNIPYKTIHSNNTDPTQALNSITKYINSTFLTQYPPTAPAVDPYLRLEEERQRAEWERWVKQNSFEIKTLFRNWGMEITDSQVLDLAKGVNRTLINLYQALVNFEPYREIYHQYYGRNPFEGEEIQALAKKLEASPFKGTAEVVKNIAIPEITPFPESKETTEIYKESKKRERELYERYGEPEISERERERIEEEVRKLYERYDEREISERERERIEKRERELYERYGESGVPLRGISEMEREWIEERERELYEKYGKGKKISEIERKWIAREVRRLYSRALIKAKRMYEGIGISPSPPPIIEAYKGYVVLVRSDSDADLEAANALAGAIGGKVIRVSPSGRLTKEQLNEISSSPGAFIIGGAKSISLDLDETLMKAGVLTNRIFGETAADTKAEVERFISEEAAMQELGSRSMELIRALQSTFATPQEFGRFLEASEKVSSYGESWQELMEKELGVRMSFEEMQEALMGRAGYGTFEDLLKRAQASYKLRWARTQGVKF